MDDLRSLEWLCARHAERVRGLFAGLALDAPGLAAVKAAAEAADWPAACAALVAYYRACGSGAWLRHAPVAAGNGTDPNAERAARAEFALPGGVAQIPRLASGGLDWAHVPAANGGVEWAYGVNRHDYMGDVLRAFYATGNRAYVRCLDEHLRDWCLQAERPEKQGNTFPWGTILEVGHRAKAWPAVFYGLQEEEGFAAATRILVLSQALDHAGFTRQFWSGGSNWVITEMCGLLSIACAWPEFREAAQWRELALRVMQAELRAQVYPDGVQKELSSNYQMAVLWHMGHFLATVRGARLELEPGFLPLLERMWNYLAYALGPAGFTPHNGDSDRCLPAPDASVLKPLELVQPLLEAASAHGRPDWTYIATNGARGERPAGLPSVVFPWAGQVIMRSGWDAAAHWAYFDAGPWGTLHQHHDALHLSVSAHGRDLLVDSGRYTYEHYWAERGTWRSYFIGSQAHNVILVDGQGQGNGPKAADRPLGAECAAVRPEFDFAWGAFANGFGDVETVAARHKSMMYGESTYADVRGAVVHERAVVYVRGAYWVVVDRIVTGGPHRITALWHFHPDCTVARAGQAVATVDAGVGNLQILPVGPTAWDIELVRGREGPDFQGWYSPAMDVKLPNTCACYSATVDRPTTVAWVLLPAKGAVPAAVVTDVGAPEGAAHLVVDVPGGVRAEVAVRLAPGVPLALLDGTPVDGPCAVRRLG